MRHGIGFCVARRVCWTRGMLSNKLQCIIGQAPRRDNLHLRTINSRTLRVQDWRGTTLKEICVRDIPNFLLFRQHFHRAMRCCHKYL